MIPATVRGSHAMIPEIEQHRDEIIALCEEFGVEALYVLGSATTHEFDPKRSDIDLLVMYPDCYDYGAFGANYVFSDRGHQ